MTPEPTQFHIEDGKLVQQQEVRRWRGTKTPALTIPYTAAFKARLKLTDINTNYNGSTYITWITGTGAIVYSNINDYKHIVLNAEVTPLAWYEGTFKFMTRGGAYRSLALVSPLLVNEPNIADIAKPTGAEYIHAGYIDVDMGRFIKK
jgi:hypothetical protein